jgi:hypothetical protein
MSNKTLFVVGTATFVTAVILWDISASTREKNHPRQLTVAAATEPDPAPPPPPSQPVDTTALARERMERQYAERYESLMRDNGFNITAWASKDTLHLQSDDYKDTNIRINVIQAMRSRHSFLCKIGFKNFEVGSSGWNSRTYSLGCPGK